MARNLGIKEAKQRAGRFCAFRERSPNELLEKIQSWGLSEESAAKLVAELTKEGFVDEQRFANAYCNDKFEFNSWGKNKIKASIYSHKLSSTALQEALDRIDPEKYAERLFDLAKTKWERLSSEEKLKRKQKTVSYLANKGFEQDLIWAAIEKLEAESL
ncbi:regulatory protein [Ekhidna lutea]|uniref:Regulatory protein RecX n=1 Tax=Ekhidna lutea TaxID=447679 RepID=A0A239ET00_EKHLU|nr:regulatory protein RecX [Ekhidna lutea]SNS47806.1 regulatory protein [Ekhidna lutea]